MWFVIFSTRHFHGVSKKRIHQPCRPLRVKVRALGGNDGHMALCNKCQPPICASRVDRGPYPPWGAHPPTTTHFTCHSSLDSGPHRTQQALGWGSGSGPTGLCTWIWGGLRSQDPDVKAWSPGGRLQARCGQGRGGLCGQGERAGAWVFNEAPMGHH